MTVAAARVAQFVLRARDEQREKDHERYVAMGYRLVSPRRAQMQRHSKVAAESERERERRGIEINNKQRGRQGWKTSRTELRRERELFAVEFDVSALSLAAEEDDVDVDSCESRLCAMGGRGLRGERERRERVGCVLRRGIS